jgi:quinohemoprotein ethanol dehydrogenase
MKVARRWLAAALLLGAVALLAAGCGGGGSTSKTEAQTATTTASTPAGTSTSDAPAALPATFPAFTADQLSAVPGDNWLTNGGSITNDRFSSLADVDTSNVANLRGDWITHLSGSGLASKYSLEGQPIAYNGTLYVPTGADDVFAVDATTGRIKWTYRAHLPDSLASVVCCGWDNRGVAIGDGRVFLGQLDGTLVALDQNTGEVAWRSSVASPKDGYTVTMAPLYYDGRIYIGPVGAEYGTRGRMDAYDATTGRRVWRFWNVPGPGEAGHETWPKDNDEWKHGGATTWNVPSVDPSLGLIYYSTANAGSDFDGRNRAGDNLYSASIVALDATSGRIRWHYQEVHHDIWDYDAPSPTVLVDAPINGTTVHGIAQPQKNGYVYFLDRATGKPVFPIPETAVPQNAIQRTAKTQPIPTMKPFSPTKVSKQQLKAVQAAADAAAPRGTKAPKIQAGSIYNGWGTLPGTPPKAYTPNNAGGDNWPPSSYNPQSHMYYVCSQSSATASTLTPKVAAYRRGRIYFGGQLFASQGFNTPGLLTAYDMTTGRIVWQKHFPRSCYSGAVSTAGNLVFVGRNEGQLEAYNGTTGEKLWSFQTGAGANSTAAVYRVGGRERIAFLAGGNALAGTAHGDSLWQFSLDGTLGQVRAGSSATAIQHAGESSKTKTGGESRSPADTRAVGDVAAGRSVFSSNCSVCHGDRGQGGNGGPNLTTIPAARTVAGVVKQVTNGGGGMPAFGGQLSAKQISDVAAFVTRTITNK